MIPFEKTLLAVIITFLAVSVVSSVGQPTPPPVPYPIPGHVYEINGSVVEGAKVTLTNLT